MDASNLGNTITTCHIALQQSPFRSLLPVYRQQIYRLLGSGAGESGRLRLGTLALNAAYRVAALWEHARPMDNRLQDVLVAARSILHEDADPEAALSQLGAAVDWLSLLFDEQTAWLYESDQRELPPASSSEDSILALRAALAALQVSVGQDYWAGREFFESSTDSDLEEEEVDAPLWALRAVLGTFELLEADNQRRLEFWTWWLSEAVPNAAMRILVRRGT